MAEKYNKLVRDRIPEILDGQSIPYEKRIASSEEYRLELIKKLDEEIKELIVSGDIKELADIMEVIEALKKLPEYADVEAVRVKKREDRGGFDKKLILTGEKN